MEKDVLQLGPRQFHSRLFVGTGKFSSWELIPKVVEAAASEMVTVALRRVDPTNPGRNILEYLPEGITILPNTSGAATAEEAVRIARIARAAGCGDFVKIEVVSEMKYLIPDNYQTLKATETLAKEGFVVLPYVLPAPNTARSFQDAGAAAIMPLGAPIGSNKGLRTRDLIQILLEYSDLPVIVDAGIGRPSHAAEAMEMGAAAVLTDTAIATAADPVKMAEAMKWAVRAGRRAFLAGPGAERDWAEASSPLTGFLKQDA
ncbi:MAG: thiazole synthase [Calditrichia bacterium]